MKYSAPDLIDALRNVPQSVNEARDQRASASDLISKLIAPLAMAGQTIEPGVKELIASLQQPPQSLAKARADRQGAADQIQRLVAVCAGLGLDANNLPTTASAIAGAMLKAPARSMMQLQCRADAIRSMAKTNPALEIIAVELPAQFRTLTEGNQLFSALAKRLAVMPAAPVAAASMPTPKPAARQACVGPKPGTPAAFLAEYMAMPQGEKRMAFGAAHYDALSQALRDRATILEISRRNGGGDEPAPGSPMAHARAADALPVGSKERAAYLAQHGAAVHRGLADIEALQAIAQRNGLAPVE